MERIAAVLTAASMAVGCSGAPEGVSDEPTREDVVAMLAEFAYDGGDDERADEAFEYWGDRALPHLDAETREVVTYDRTRHLLEAYGAVGSPAAAKSIASVLEGRTRVSVHDVLADLSREDPLRREWRSTLGREPRFRSAVVALLDSDSAYDRAAAVRIVGRYGWMDAADRVRDMLDDPDLHLREDAAEALEALTGRRPEVARPELDFPRVDLNPHAVSPALELDLGRFRRVRGGVIRTDRRHGPVVLAFTQRGFGGARLVTLSPEGDELEATATDVPTHGAIAFDDDPRGLILLVGRFSGEELVAFDAEGDELWREPAEHTDRKQIATLWGASGAVGVVAGIDGDVVAFDREQKILFDLRDHYVIHQLSTHPRVPDRILELGGRVNLLELEDVRAPRVREITVGHRFYATDGALFPDVTGGPAIVACGSDEDSLPTLLRATHDGTVVWSTQLPSDGRALVCLDDAPDRQLFVLATSLGRLLTFDADGRLVDDRLVEGADGEREVPIYGLASGRLGEGSIGVLVQLLEATHLYRYDVDALFD